jgi:hypothetical protein
MQQEISCLCISKPLYAMSRTEHVVVVGYVIYVT